MEQQVAVIFHVVQTLRQMLAQQEQRHAHEIQGLQDKMTTTKPNNWDTMNNFKNVKLFSSSTKFRSQVTAGDEVVAAQTVMLEAQVAEKDWNTTVRSGEERCEIQT